MKNRTEAIINLKAIETNAKNIISTLKPNCQMLAVVKADAYGHGAMQVAERLYNIGVRYFAVATVDEGAELREKGLKGEILVLGKTDVSFSEMLAKYDLCQACDSVEYAKAIANGGARKIHIKIDTGMSRLGFYCHDVSQADVCVENIAPIFTINNLSVEGVFTHFAVADEDIDFTEKQFNAFKTVTDKLTALGYKIGLRHCCNSAATIRFPHMHLDMVRQGIGLYGLERSVPEFPMHPAMTVNARIAAVGELESDDTVSYGRTFKTDKPLRRAVVSFGYADGMPRLLSNRYSVTVNGKKAPIIGRICMDMFMINVSNIECSEGDTVTVFGAKGEVSEMADIIGTINYEIVCGITRRVPRVYEE